MGVKTVHVCLVCGKENSTLLCENCGFDESSNYYKYPTLSRVPPRTVRKERLLKYGKKEDFENGKNRVLHCTKCGGTDFCIVLPHMEIQCANCRSSPRNIKCIEKSAFDNNRTDNEIKDFGFNLNGSKGFVNNGFNNSNDRIVTENLFSECEGWRDIISVSAGSEHIVGLRKNGTVVACGNNNFGQCNTADWSDIAAISAGAFHTVGIRKNGTAVAVGKDTDGQCQVYSWRDITAVSAGKFHTLGLTKIGTVTAVGRKNDNMCNVGLWKKINGISAGTFHSVVLKRPVVYAVGSGHNGECDVYGWKGVSAVSAGEFFTLGLLKNGQVIAAGKNDYCQCNVNGWTQIVGISAGTFVSAGLRKDGLVITTDENLNKSISDWNNIKEVSVGEYCIAGLKNNGTVLTAPVKRYLK